MSSLTPKSTTTSQNLIQVSESEVIIDFKPGTKCRSTLHLRSLHPISSITFKVQTSSPAKFHVNPPSGLLPPLSIAALHVILRPQPLPPSSFPRSPTDRFLIKATLFSSSPNSIEATQDIKLKVVYVGPFLLRHAAATGDAAAVRNLLRRQPHLTTLLPSPSVAEAGIGGEGSGWSRVHAAAAAGEWEEMRRALEEEDVEMRDGEGRTAVMVAAGKGKVRCVKELVERWGAEIDGRSRDGRTALYRAAANGDVEMVVMLLELGADVGIATVRGRTPLDVGKEKGHVSF